MPCVKVLLLKCDLMAPDFGWRVDRQTNTDRHTHTHTHAHTHTHTHIQAATRDKARVDREQNY